MRAITLIIIAIAGGVGCRTYTEGLVQSVDRAHESVVIVALHNIALAQKTYSISHDGDYGTLAELAEGGYLDAHFGSEQPVKDYTLSLTVTPASADHPQAGYSCAADPQEGKKARHFYIDSTSDGIHVNATQAASATDPLVQ